MVYYGERLRSVWVSMRKIVFIASMFLVVSLLLSACNGYTKEIEEVVKNSNLDFKLTEDEMNLDYSDNYEKLEGFGCYSLLSEDGLTRYTISGYPDCLDEYKLTGFSTYDPKYSIFGICVGGDPDNAIAILEERSYKKVEKKSDLTTSVYKKGKVFIQIFAENDEINFLSVYLDITNKKNVVF